MEAFMQIIDELMKSKDIEKDEMMRIIRESLKDAYIRKHKLKPENDEEEEYELPLDVEINKGKLYVFLSKEVRKNVDDEHKQINIDKAKEMLNTDDIEEGDIIDIFIEPKDLGRNGARIVKENIMNRIRGVEEGRVYDEYKDKENQIFTAIVMRKQRLRGREREKFREEWGNDKKELANIIVDLGKGEAIIKPNHQSPKDNYYRGSRMKVYLYKVKRSGLSTDIFASRTHQNLVTELLKLEVPEVESNQVKVDAISRKPGYKTKVAVSTNNPELDPVGTCVGMRGIRIQNVVRELNGERIDVIEYTDNPKEMIKRALKNIDVVDVIITDEEKNEAKVVVPDQQYTMAIGRGGQNVALAARITGWKIYIYSDSEYREELEKLREEKLEQLKNLEIVNEEIFEMFKENGIKSLEDITHTHPDFMAELIDVELKQAEEIIETAKEKIQKQKEEDSESEKEQSEEKNEKEKENENENNDKENKETEDKEDEK
ncbi:MAG: transcription termination factor NusA [Candidatus Mcinerneyibacterium aminivorans]|uniref:Transcription termination/antitermination protein NusA n=1 Tax=Candidatus Mcinerneyibacterium aminivorans TaxID=2703815 RepID=A0A5D0MN11_9BACT|nr:MAG: transcription termination factor NusA [Candidatus Mcinerneyibacterium aminivorans]